MDASPPRETLARLDELCKKALFAQAYEITRGLAPLATWRGARALVVASRLAHHLGAPALSDTLGLRAYRAAPHDADALLLWSFTLSTHRGPYEAWRRLGAITLAPDASPAKRAHLTRARAVAAAQMRDMEAAHALLAQAEREHPPDADSAVDRAAVLMREDRLEDALAVAREALGDTVTHRRLVLATARILTLLGRREEAIVLLARADAALESGEVAGMLATLQTEADRWEEARRSLDRVEALSPLLEDEGRRQLAGARSELAYRLGDIDMAIAEAERSGHPFLARVAARLRERSEGKRVRLEVGFVRQHHLTCVPATLTILARFWDKPAEHLEIAEAICYDGTPAHSERKWADEHGFVTRELTVTWESAVALLDRGVPFVLTTSFAANGHAQAIIGYDERRGTLDVRDPYVPLAVEAAAEPMLEGFRATGPRGLVLVPREEAARLDGLDLPDTALYDTLYRLERALADHDRAAAAEALDAIEREAPGHVLAIRGRRALAAYDADEAGVIAAAEAQLALFPKDANAELTRISAMEGTASREARIARLEAILARGPADVIFTERLAGELAADARHRPRAARLLRGALRAGSERAEPYVRLAQIHAEEGRAEEAASLFRFGASVEPTQELGARAYFGAAWQRGRAAEALSFLEQRVARLGDRSGQPAITLCEALEALDRPSEGLAVLDGALARRPADGDLLLAAARTHARYAGIERARELLAAAEGRARRAAWLRTAAYLEERSGAPDAALARMREVLIEEPFAEDAHRAVALRLDAGEGDAAARAHVDAACARFPHHRALHRLRVELLFTQAPATLEGAIRAFLELEPGSAWAKRELALCLSRQGRLTEARTALAEARAVEPEAAETSLLAARIALREGDRAGARDALREAVRRAPDLTAAIQELAATSRTAAEAADDLDFLDREVLPHSGTGAGVLAFYVAARQVRSPKALAARLDALRAARRDLPEPTILALRNQIDRGRFAEALPLAEDLTARFPLLAQAWLELAAVHGLLGDGDAEIEALGRALALGRGHPTPVLALARALQARDPARARVMLEEAVALAPRSPTLLGALAERLWNAKERDAAIARLTQATAAAPTSRSAWQQLAWACNVMGEPQHALALVRAAAERQPWNAEVQLCLGDIAATLHAPEEALRAADAALAIDPRLVEAHELRARVLAALGRLDDALAACAPEVFAAEGLPIELLGRAAVIDALAGRAPQAVEHLRELTAAYAGYAFGWAQLVSLHRRAQRHDEERAAAKALVRASPSASSCAALADACLAQNDAKGAIDACQRAVALEPDHAPTSFALVDLLLDARDTDRAATALARIAPHFEGRVLASRRVRLALMTRRYDDARAEARALLRDRDAANDALYAVINLLFQSDARRTAELVDALCEERDAHPEVGALWVKLRAKRGYRVSAWRLRRLVADRPELGRCAVLAAFDVAGEDFLPISVLWLLFVLRRVCAADVECWAAAGASLEAVGQHLLASAWLRGWRRRAGLRPFMLAPLVSALRAWMRTARATAVSRHALTLPADASTPLHRAWIAFEESIAGDTAAAQRELSLLPEELAGEPLQVASMARAVTRIQSAKRRKRPALLQDSRNDLLVAAPAGSPLVARSSMSDAHLRARRRIARDLDYALGALLEAYPVHIATAFLALLWWGAARGGGLDPSSAILILPVVIAAAAATLRWMLARL
ncbi:TPR domain protein [Minicystis rosea]|nr:TPR domain protein [Minicystis rosea]